MPAIEERVSRLEAVLEEFIKSVGIEFNKLYNSQMRTETEMREFKNEMREFRDDTREQNREMNRKWGDIANKLGTITEDLVAPSIPRIVQEEFNLEVSDLIVRRKKKLKDGRVKEYDVIASTDEYVFVTYTKSTMKSVDIDYFIQDIQTFKDFSPEYDDKKLIGILASLYIDESIIVYAENAGFMVISVGDKMMEVKNRKGFKPKE